MFKLLLVWLVASVCGHQDFEEDPEAYLVNQREKPLYTEQEEAPTQIDFPKTNDSYKLYWKFNNESAEDYQLRGDVVVTRNKNNNKIVSVEIVDLPIKNGTQGKDDIVWMIYYHQQAKHYLQLAVPELGLLTSTKASYYSIRLGLNDTITFNLDLDSQRIISMQVDYSDKVAQANHLGLNKKKRTAFLTPQWEEWNGKASLKSMADGILPSFEKTAYDSQGAEQVAKHHGSEKGDEGAPPAEQSFIQKYWWHLLIGFLVL